MGHMGQDLAPALAVAPASALALAPTLASAFAPVLLHPPNSKQVLKAGVDFRGMSRKVYLWLGRVLIHG